MRGRRFRNSLLGHKSLVDKLTLHKELRGHAGCVNRLCWNETGTKLASVSDDCKCIIWDVNRNSHLEISTEHERNIFGVAFIPERNDSWIVTGAMDFQVRLHKISPDGDCKGELFSYHTDRVKDVKTISQEPNLFWSAAEDGTIRQYDLRVPAGNPGGASGILVNLQRNGGADLIELKAIDVNAARPWYLAAACSDPVARVYDRRMLKLRSDETPGCVWEFAVEDSPNQLLFNTHATYVKFSNSGHQLLANFHANAAYLFDLDRPEDPQQRFSNMLDPEAANRVDGLFPREIGSFGAEFQGCFPKRSYHFSNRRTYTERERETNKTIFMSVHDDISAMKECLSDSIDDCSRAIAMLGQGTSVLSEVCRLRILRGNLLLKRKWTADILLALFDSQFVEASEEGLSEDNLLLRLKCLQQLERYQEAFELCAEFPDLFHKNKKLSKIRKNIKSKIQENHYEVQREDDEEMEVCSQDQEAESSDEDKMEENSSNAAMKCEAEDRKEGEEGNSTGRGASMRKGEQGIYRPQVCDPKRFRQRYLGHANVQTDIKECTFMGKDDQFVVGGSDDGKAYIWDRKTGKLLRILSADQDIVNCCQANPHEFLLATSGIEDHVRLWRPNGRIGVIASEMRGRDAMEDYSSEDEEETDWKTASRNDDASSPREQFCVSDEKTLKKHVELSQKSRRSGSRARNIPFPPGILLQTLQQNMVYDPATDMLEVRSGAGPRLVSCRQQ
ncbi:hypothetical protein GUITHDRAFT_107932 [Guillardia theta CCMP2712]|uniref:Uncharacterized protein n=1 Tax=Guillardia theta (strain CCMP2712) TaxID=905079 RepID=L1JDY1_GUITC|nr:hypothetical protein GUITHDRAFT_107932 [Guillardia theta CCMP2712]EKX46324.1 hypothetical protein GUITHDRAFT_107932 [Guillardia theta CCMP2712]|eukprot:XP_005833304.1 hypothetical protein GUITHDRAFT_107932 [Guillardia theta CCMP2712]